MVRLVIIVLIAIFCLLNNAEAGKSASTTAVAKTTVIKSIGIVKNNDLDFGEATGGDPVKVVDPNAQQGASFTVTGEPNKAFNVTLPATTVMTTGDGVGAQKQILVDSFSSNPANSGNLGNAGTQSLFVGAKRAALPNNQVGGSYSSTFTITVAYP